MPLVGTLSTMPVADLLQWLASSGSTGILTFERNKVAKRIVFRDGQVIACSTAEPSELLGHFLVSRGKIGEDTLRAALARQEESGGHLGGILVELGALTGAELTASLTAKAEETIYSLFDIDEALFRFESCDISEERVPFPLDLRVEDILLRGMQRIDEMREIRTVFNDPGIVLRRSHETPPEEIHRNRVARRIYDLVNGERTVAEILLHAHASEYLVTKFLFQLLRNGMVEVAKAVRPEPTPHRSGTAPSLPEPPAPVAAGAVVRGPSGNRSVSPAAATVTATRPAAQPAVHVSSSIAPPPVDPRASLESDLEVAGNLVKRGEFDAAIEILNETYKAHPGDQTLGRLLAEAEACFLEKAYRHLLPAGKVPVLLRPAEDLATEQISPEEYFLLSRIDGTWDVKSIIQVTPMREVDVVRTLKRMREKGFIELRDPGAGAS
jgi:hypothetical protein